MPPLAELLPNMVCRAEQTQMPQLALIVGPGDADAGGAPTAATITGTDQATPLATLRRLIPPSSLLVSFSFITSDNCAPKSVSAAVLWTG